ncbi:hypothetical protein OCAE111667_02555 [Occultella aeris]|uniref:Uncharacterized protein n=1 Tax=Occultella aeris TaxID=2761496 RepID=A0A7M4DGH0_9MICO|nr:hypothetical protein [Occultella aeris]VZO36013.1 hypothetical protein HALOF300_01217 [Occultella aeris]
METATEQFDAPGVGGVSLDPPIQALPPQLRQPLGVLIDVLESNGTGLIITIDEVHRGAIEDLRAIATTVQHLIREGREIALAMAGLPASVSTLLNDHVITFLRRADRRDLAHVRIRDVSLALWQTFAEGGVKTQPRYSTRPPRQPVATRS